jgi:hypothetical protein
LPLLERVRVEVYIPDPSIADYENLLLSFEAEFTYAFGGCTILRGLEGCYLARFGNRIHDRINVIYSDIPLALSIEFAAVSGYVREVKRAATEALAEEAVMVAVTRVYHSV